MRRHVLLLFVPILIAATLDANTANGDDGAVPAKSEKLPGEAEFESLQAAYRAALDRWRTAFAKVKTEEEKERLSGDAFPPNNMAGRFLDLELKHRGTLVGLSALHHLVSQGAGGGRPGSPVYEGRRKALRILGEHYAKQEDLDVFIDELDAGVRDPEAKTFLRQAASSPHAGVRGAALFTLAAHLKDEATIPQKLQSELELANSDPNRHRSHLKLLNSEIPLWSDVQPEASRAEALKVIDEVMSRYGDVLEPRNTPYGPIMLRPANFNELPRRPLRALAESLRFELERLTIGQPAVEIAGPDAFGSDMKLSDQKGRVVVLFFSYKGCGPCESRYPSNRKLIKDFADRPFTFLGVMGDETLATVKESVDKGDITWRVWWDGGDTRGPLASQWNVHGWPETYVLDHQGIIRYREVYDDLLEAAVAKLVAEAEKAKTN